MLFLSGMDVTVVNDRTEDYTRGQMLTLDGRWTNQMNWLLGTQFDQMLEGEDAVGKKFPELYKVQMGLKYLEDALKHRLATLVSYVESQNEGSIFQLFYEVAFEKVQFPNETDRQFKALLKPSDKCLVKGKVVSLRCSKTVVFDVLASVGGAADSTRDTYIGIPREYTIPKRFATSTFRRGANLKKVQFLPLPFGRYFETYENVRPFLQFQDMEKLIKENEFVPELLKDKYRNLTKHILQGFQGDSDSQIDESFQDATYATRDLETEQFYLPAFENYKCLSLGVVVEKALDLFFTDVEARIKTAQLDNDMKEARSLRTLKDRVLRKFLTALTLKLIRTAHNEKYIDVINISEEGDALPNNPDKINFDPYPVNTTTFVLTQASLKTPAVLYKVHGKTALFMALGDSMASPHFFSGSGISTGREGVEITAEIMQKYNHAVNDSDNDDSADQLAKDINHGMEYIKDEVQKRGIPFAKQRDQSNVKQLARQKCRKLFKGIAIKSKQKENLVHEFDFKIACSLDSHFQVQTLKGNFNGHVDEEGELFVSKNTFATLAQAVVALTKQN